MRKAQKKKILIAGDHFNRDEKKGSEHLKLNNLVSDPPDAKAYAFFFRYTPGLDKKVISDYLGDPDEFHLQVLKDFTATFNFSGMILDTALRTYLASFRLPGESQKIQRILEASSEAFFQQQTSDIFATKGALFILCYSLMMLNTDQHNPLLDLLADSVNLLIQWYKEYSDPGSCFSVSSSSSLEDNSRGFGSSNFSMNLFIKLGEAFRKTSLARREEVRNHSIISPQKAFALAEELDFPPQNSINCFNLVIFAMVDDLHEKMRSMEGTLKIAMELWTEVFLQFLKSIPEWSF